MRIRIFKTTMLAAMLIFLNSIAMAFPFTEVVGYVSLGSATVVDNLDGTSTITGLEYFFTVTDDAGTGAEMDMLSLEFEGDVFSYVSTAYDYNPTDWTSSTISSTNSSYTLSIAGTTLGVGETLSFSIDAIIFTDALTNASLWDEGQIWGQSWFSSDTLEGGDGGSTAPVPEPTSMLLFGTGIAGLAVFHRKRKKS